MTRFALVFALLFSIAGTAAAQEKPKRERNAPATRYDFEDDVVVGDLAGPFGEVSFTTLNERFGSILPERQHFVTEIVRSAEDFGTSTAKREELPATFTARPAPKRLDPLAITRVQLAIQTVAPAKQLTPAQQKRAARLVAFQLGKSA